MNKILIMQKTDCDTNKKPWTSVLWLRLINVWVHLSVEGIKNWLTYVRTYVKTEIIVPRVINILTMIRKKSAEDTA